MPDADAKFERALTAILGEARAQVAAGRAPNVEGLEVRLAAAARSTGVDAAAVDSARRSLRSIGAVHRSRAVVARDPARPRAAQRGAPAALRARPPARPTVTGSLGVRRADGDGFRLAWDAVPVVTEWEVRFSERADARSEWVEGEKLVLGGDETGVELPLGNALLRVNIIGRGRGGRLHRRGLLSGVVRQDWPRGLQGRGQTQHRRGSFCARPPRR